MSDSLRRSVAKPLAALVSVHALILSNLTGLGLGGLGGLGELAFTTPAEAQNGQTLYYVTPSGCGGQNLYLPGTLHVPTMDVSGNTCNNGQGASGGTSVSITPVPSGGLGTPFSNNVTSTASAVDANPGQIYGWYFFNNSSGACYAQLFNAAASAVTVGTTAPYISLGVPANGGSTVFPPPGAAFSTAISIAATTTRSGSTACAAGIDANVWYR